MLHWREGWQVIRQSNMALQLAEMEMISWICGVRLGQIGGAKQRWKAWKEVVDKYLLDLALKSGYAVHRNRWKAKVKGY